MLDGLRERIFFEAMFLVIDLLRPYAAKVTVALLRCRTVTVYHVYDWTRDSRRNC